MYIIKMSSLTDIAFDLWDNGDLRVSILQPKLSSILYKGEVTLNKREVKALKNFIDKETK